MDVKNKESFLGTFDVAVVGGGVAGCAAALSAARCGQKAVLVEKLYLLGGLATSGLVTYYLPICDGMGHQVSFSLAEELLHLSGKYGAEEPLSSCWQTGGKRDEKSPRYTLRCNPQAFALALEEELLREGVTVFYGAYVTDTLMDGDKIQALTVETKGGRQTLSARCFVDATGDGDLLRMAGAPTENFKQGNVLAGWYYSTGREGYRLRTLGSCDTPEEEKTEEMKKKPDTRKRYLGLSCEEVSDYVKDSHRLILEDVKKRQKEDETYLPVTLPTMPQLRMTRRLLGEYRIGLPEMHTVFPDSVGLVSDWRKRGPVYEVPFRTLYSGKVKNLISSGRCTSSTEGMWEVLRVIPCCAVTGEAAGLAATLTDDFSQLDVSLLQRKLRERGVRLHENEVEE